MKRKIITSMFILILVFVFLFGVSTVQKIQSNEIDTETIILDKDGNQIEPVGEDAKIYGR